MLRPRVGYTGSAEPAGRGLAGSAGESAMPGMTSGLNANDPVVVAAFRAALLRQGLIALLIFMVLGLTWAWVRGLLPGREAAL